MRKNLFISVGIFLSLAASRFIPHPPNFTSLQALSFYSVLVIGLMSQYFSKNINLRVVGSLFGAFIFFLITNFGVWASGMYSLTINGFIECYSLAIPFFAYSLISTILFSLLIETGYKILKNSLLKI